jgi:hypothetical protein
MRVYEISVGFLWWPSTRGYTCFIKPPKNFWFTRIRGDLKWLTSAERFQPSSCRDLYEIAAIRRNSRPSQYVTVSSLTTPPNTRSLRLVMWYKFKALLSHNYVPIPRATSISMTFTWVLSPQRRQHRHSAEKSDMRADKSRFRKILR